MCLADVAATGPGSGRAPPSCRRRLEWWSARVPRSHGQDQRWDGYCEHGGVPRPQPAASVLEFCLVFCTVSGLGQSSLWSITVHWILLSCVP